MTRQQIEKVRSVSKSGDSGPWGGWYDEMARKSVIRRLSKRLPMSTDLERVIRRDDEFYDLRQARTVAQSGTDAAKALLGITAPLGDGESDLDDGEPEGDQQQTTYTDESAIAALKEAGSTRDLERAWAGILVSYDNQQREIPVPVNGAYTDRKEYLRQLEGQSGGQLKL